MKKEEPLFTYELDADKKDTITNSQLKKLIKDIMSSLKQNDKLKVIIEKQK